MIIKNALGTESASDYGAPVIELFREGSARHIVVHWGAVTELYAIDTDQKTFSIAQQKFSPFKATTAFVGKCE